jgi:hypothetical protein
VSWRRLIVLVSVVALGGALASSLAPRDLRRPPAGSGPSDTEQRTVPRPASRGRRVHASVRANAENPPVVRTRVGDLVELRVAVERPSTLAVGSGRVEAGDRDTPATFGFIVQRPGRLAVRRVEDGATVAILRVAR